MTEPLVTTIDLLRHGHCLWPAGFYGRSDNPLSPTGREQMESSLSAAGADYQRVLTSPLSRCAGFAHPWAQQQGVPSIELELLVEGSLGRWEGKTLEQLELSDGQALQDFWRDPLAFPPPGAESLDQLQARMAQVMALILDQHRGESLLVVTHSGVIRAAIMDLLGCGPQAWRTLAVPHGSLSRVRVYHQQGSADWFQLECFGVTGY
ncbi:histidine phosphatase family protein [Aestuariirhabdus litorea]|uniref:histidine phosphatase family protein n=1 Tax=Aestuariirhabdus litorea TaxID=2528527 RepID=UPI0013E3D076|nr:histidine phosphatase family protein [Aestuariirhabdus litorea]